MAGGLKAKRTGEFYEQVFDLSLRFYQSEGLAVGATNYPQVAFLAKGRARVVGKALPDRVVTIQGGQVCWVEIKSFTAKETHKYNLVYRDGQRINTGRLNQYHNLLLQRSFGAISIYIVAFHDTTDWLDWRIFEPGNFDQLPVVTWRGGEPDALQFERLKGTQVYSPNGFPDWLPEIYK